MNSAAVTSNSAMTQEDDHALIERIATAYRYASTRFAGHGTSFWADFNRDCQSLHDALMRDDVAVAGSILRDPHNAPIHLLRGFYDLTRTVRNAEAGGDFECRRQQENMIAGLLVALAEAVGAVRYANPEAAGKHDQSIEDTLAALDERLGFRIDFPNPYPGEIGLVTSRGIANERSAHAIYQAWLVSELGGPRVLEIGAGLGLVAYYARQLGLTYTIVDLPLSNAAQADFLGRALGPEKIALSGEQYYVRTDRTGIFGPEWFLSSTEHFDVILNADSLPEMDTDQAVKYVDKICANCDVFLSINHEAGAFRVSELLALPGCPFERHRYWLRDGYVEEVARFGGMTTEIERLRNAVSRLSRKPSNSRRELIRRFVNITLGRPV
jgi:SAM-dependent methyltransferase